jgi:hypothetical protein
MNPRNFFAELRHHDEIGDAFFKRHPSRRKIDLEA